MNLLKLFITFALIVTSASCSMVDENLDGNGGRIEGTLVKLDDDISADNPFGTYGIDGTATPVGKLFFASKDVRYRLDNDSVSYVIGGREDGTSEFGAGDSVTHLFDYIEIGEGDWNTVIHPYSE